MPNTVEETFLFVQRVTEFLVEFPKKFGHGSLGSEDDSESKTKHSGYIRKHLVRKFIDWARGRTPSDLWDAWTLEQVLAVTPDKMNLLHGVPRSWNGLKIKNKFAVNIFMFSCWVGLFHSMPMKYRADWAKPTMKLQQLMLQKKDENGGCEPNLCTLAALFYVYN